MDLRFTQDWITSENEKASKKGEVMFISKAKGYDNSEFENIVQFIDEAGNELNCTVSKFIEIFDNQGLEGFLL